jgi:hypothetical protein
MANSKVSEVNKKFSSCFQRALSAVTSRQWQTTSHFRIGKVIKSYFLNPALKFKTIDNKAWYSLRAHMITEVVDVVGTEKKKVRTREYIYGISDNTGNALLEFHWHPNKINPMTLEIAAPTKTQKVIQTPHIHVYANNEYLRDLRKRHIPSGRVAFEDIISFLVNDLKVKPHREDWEHVLAETRKLFDSDKTW